MIIRVPTVEGVLQLKAFRDRVQARSGPLFVAWITGATLFLIVVSVIFIRNQVRPIEKLADAMERFGRGADTGRFRVRGAREVRGATNAFFDMRARIRRHIEQRAQLLVSQRRISFWQPAIIVVRSKPASEPSMTLRQPITST